MSQLSFATTQLRVLFWSKYSNYSGEFLQLLETVPVHIRAQLNLKNVCIDSAKVKSRLTTKTMSVQHVPCVLVVHPTGIVEQYEANDAFDWLQSAVQQLLPPPTPPPVPAPRRVPIEYDDGGEVYDEEENDNEENDDEDTYQPPPSRGPRHMSSRTSSRTRTVDDDFDTKQMSQPSQLSRGAQQQARERGADRVDRADRASTSASPQMAAAKGRKAERAPQTAPQQQRQHRSQPAQQRNKTTKRKPARGTNDDLDRGVDLDTLIDIDEEIEGVGEDDGMKRPPVPVRTGPGSFDVVDDFTSQSQPLTAQTPTRGVRDQTSSAKSIKGEDLLARALAMQKDRETNG